MIEHEELRQRAHDGCQQHVAATLEGEFEIEMGEAASFWDDHELRHVFEQHMVIWRRFGTFDVWLDAEDRPVGYADPGQWEGCEWALLTHDDIHDIRQQVALTLPETAIEKAEQGKEGSLVVTLRESGTLRDPGRWQIQINPARRSIISVSPLSKNDDRR